MLTERSRNRRNSGREESQNIIHSESRVSSVTSSEGRVLTIRSIVTFKGCRYEKSIDKTPVGSRVQTPKSLESPTKHNKLEVVAESRERVYKREQRGKICRYLQRRSGDRRIRSRDQRIIVSRHSRLDTVVQQQKDRENSRSQLEKWAHDARANADRLKTCICRQPSIIYCCTDRYEFWLYCKESVDEILVRSDQT